MALHPYNALWQFQSSFGQPHSVVPGLPAVARRELRKNLLAEEYQEYLDGEQNNDLREIGDALIDMVYIIYGTGIEYGLPMGELFDEVHRSNMTKIDPQTGRVIRREDGKIMKPASYSPPDLNAIIDRRNAAVGSLILDGFDPHEVLAPEMPSAPSEKESLLESAYNPLSILDDYFFAQDSQGEASDCCAQKDAVDEIEELHTRIDVVEDAIEEAAQDIAEALRPVERFAVYVTIPAGTRADVSKKLVADFKDDFMNDVANQGDDALYYFLPTTGKPKIARL